MQGTTGKLDSIMDHHAFPTIESFVEKHNRYSNWEAIVESSSTDDETSLQLDSVKGKRRLRRLFRKLPFRPTLRFFYVLSGKEVFSTGGPVMYLRDSMHSMNSFPSQAKAIHKKGKTRSKELLILIISSRLPQLQVHND